MKYLFVIVHLLLYPSLDFPQIGIDNPDPHPSSILDLNSADKGILIPRMTTAQREAIVSPANSLLVFDTTQGGYFYYYGGQWHILGGFWNQVGSNIYYNRGDVGIGDTPDTNYNLQITGSGTPIVGVKQTGPGQAVFELARTAGTVSKWQMYLPQSSDDVRVWNSVNGDRIFFTVDGKVGVGGPPSNTLDLITSIGRAKIRTYTSDNDESGVIIERGGTNTPARWEVYLRVGSDDLRFYKAGEDKFLFSSAGVGTGMDWVATSDRRLKENVKPVESQLDKVKTIGECAVNYDRKDTGKNETGFIAQDLSKVAPEYVNVPDDPEEMQSVNYAKMVVPLYKGTAELSDEVERLKEALAEESKEVLRLKAQVSQLNEQLGQMERLKKDVEQLKTLYRDSPERCIKKLSSAENSGNTVADNL